MTKEVSDTQLISLVDSHSLEQQLEHLEDIYVTLAKHSGTESVSDIAFSKQIKVPIAELNEYIKHNFDEVPLRIMNFNNIRIY